jgi:hypothetical protein
MALKITGTIEITNTETGETVSDFAIDITDATADEVQRLLDSATDDDVVGFSQLRRQGTGPTWGAGPRSTTDDEKADSPGPWETATWEAMDSALEALKNDLKSKDIHWTVVPDAYAPVLHLELSRKVAGRWHVVGAIKINSDRTYETELLSCAKFVNDALRRHFGRASEEAAARQRAERTASRPATWDASNELPVAVFAGVDFGGKDGAVVSTFERTPDGLRYLGSMEVDGFLDDGQNQDSPDCLCDDIDPEDRPCIICDISSETPPEEFHTRKWLEALVAAGWVIEHRWWDKTPKDATIAEKAASMHTTEVTVDQVIEIMRGGVVESYEFTNPKADSSFSICGRGLIGERSGY